MDRFSWTDGLLAHDEQLVLQQGGVRLYDGEERTAFNYGKLVLTTHRLVWRDQKDQKCVMSLHLSNVIYSEEQTAGFYKSPKIVLHLTSVQGYRPPGPVTSSSNSYIKLSFKEGGETEFYRCFTEVFGSKKWLNVSASSSASGIKKPVRTGIGGIEKKLQEKSKNVDKNISFAFEDLGKLMEKAKEMVSLSKDITNKIRDKQGEITEDETIRFKSYLLSLGISDPVTRESHGSGGKYFKELAKQISKFIETPLQECGGLMTLTDLYCRINRARGMELLSPEDLVLACKQLNALQLPVRFRVFESGVMVVQLYSHREEEAIKQTLFTVKEVGSFTADELSKYIGLSVVLAKERLLLAENVGELCRDETVEGLRFYPNLFKTEVS